ncbi:phosphatase PAP2 family protein [Microbacterium soli]|uniref:Phosphatidic acid phosphatase type 2/haloperoxidase domain-containing protein n=1 Tax=Microbacterium soli TaxID=446075 RepID=A0ABP7N7L8_9MICO
MNAARRPRALLVWGIALLVLVCAQSAAVAASVHSPWTQGVDDAWRSLIGVGPQSDVHTGLVPMLFQHLGQLPGIVLMMLIVPILLAVLGRWRSALFVLAVQLAGPGLVSQLLKNLVNRPRPAADEAAGLYGPLFLVDHGSFPSGHAVSAGAIAVLLVALIPAVRAVSRTVTTAVAVLLMVGMVWQRTLINAHWLSDTLAGLAAGVGVALVLWWVFAPWLAQDRVRTPWFLRRRIPSDPIGEPLKETS